MGITSPTWKKAVAAIASLPMMMAGLAAAPAAIADEGTATADATQTAPAPLASFDFNADPANGAFASAGGTGASAAVKGAANLVERDTDNGKAAQLGSGFWLDVTGKDGAALLKGRDAVTISYDSKPNASGNTGWSFFAASNANKQEYGKEHYVGVMDKTTGVTVERYDNNGSRDASGNVAATDTGADWKHVDIVIDGADAKLYVNQTLKAVNTTGKKLTDILGAEGGVLQVGKANWGNGEYFAGQLDNLAIYGEALTADQLGVQGAKTDYAAALAIPARITGDLPSTVLGKAVTWKAEGDGAALVAANGKVTRPEAGKASVKVKLTATIDGIATPVTAESEILDNGGELASYVKDVDRSDQNGAKYDPLAYNDDRRADSLYVASKAADGAKWETLNRSQSILSVKWDGSQSANPNAQMGSPTFFRAKDGTLGVVSSHNNATGAIYVWDGTGDGATFANERSITVTSSSIVRDPRLVYDAAANTYKVFWKDALDGEGRMATLSDLTDKATVGETLKADAPVMGVGTAADGLPAWAGEGQISAFPVSAAEYQAFHNHYVNLTNTGVEPIADVTADNGANADDVKAQVSGTKATMTYNDGSTKEFAVDWNADDLAKIDTAKAGTYEVSGTIKQVDEAMYNDARADPDIFYNEDDGYYYLTGSTYEVKSTDPNMAQKTSYRSIGLKRAKTINELKTAEEHIIIKPENGTPGHMDQYPNSFYGWSAFIWAQEFHKINGRWWIVAGFHKGVSTTNGGWCDNTILIPYTGDTQSIKDGGFLQPENWGEPTVLEGAAFDVTYFERAEKGADGQTVQQGYWLFPNGNGLYLAKAKMGDGVTPLVDGKLEHIYQVSQQFEYGKQAPTPGDNSEGSDQAIVEAPFMFAHGGYAYILYAGATVDKYYNTNVMRAPLDANLQDPASWTTAAFPSLDTNDTASGAYGADETSYERRHAGPGHISLVEDQETGNLVLAYHARPYPEIHSGKLAGGLMDQDRNTWVKAVNVRADGNLDLSLTKDQEVAPANRTVTLKVVVGSPASSDASLRSLSVAGVAVSLDDAASAEGASVEVADPAKVTADDVEAVANDAAASKPVVAVKDGVVTVTVTAEDGTTKTYKVALVKKAEPKPSLRFTDVTAATPHREDIEWLASTGISTGWPTGEGTAVFSPMGPVVRQDMAAFLYRLAGSPEFTPSDADKARFTDVTDATPHAKEIWWLASTQIAEGFKQPDGTFQFGGNRAVVRQDMAAFLKRLADYRKADPALGEGVAFTDVDEFSPHAEEIGWLSKTGVAGGFPDGSFGGMRLVVRQDMAAFLHRMDTNVLK